MKFKRHMQKSCLHLQQDNPMLAGKVLEVLARKKLNKNLQGALVVIKADKYWATLVQV